MVATITVLVLLGAGPAAACGFLVAPNGTVQLLRTTTLAAYHDGIEHYITSFEYASGVEEFGSITPLPDLPTSVERGGDWTLQRLNLEFNPPPPVLAFAAIAEDAALKGRVEVILETEIDALDIVVLKGGGADVVEWANTHGYDLPPDAADVLEYYSARSPYFMAARFDAGRAAELGQVAGDGTPIHVTIPTDDPWVPLHILAMGKAPGDVVEADVYLLTDDVPTLLHGNRGVEVVVSEAASTNLLDDLRSDVGMEWVPRDAWVTKVVIDGAPSDVDYDLAVSTDGDQPSWSDTGLSPAVVATKTRGELRSFVVADADSGVVPTSLVVAAPSIATQNATTGESVWLLLPLLAIGLAGLGLMIGGPYLMARRER
jgi:hypothetical protein